jgi:tripartite-type tricarboxylate transporter receptor subunit TctC
VSTLATAGPHIKDAKLRALAVTSKTRSQIEPQIPTMSEAGHPDIEGDSWVGGSYLHARQRTSLRSSIAKLLPSSRFRK